MTKGTIATLGERNSGFIRIESSGEDLFFHADAVANGPFADLRVGDAVQCTRTESRKGPYATRVERVS